VSLLTEEENCVSVSELLLVRPDHFFLNFCTVLKTAFPSFLDRIKDYFPAAIRATDMESVAVQWSILLPHCLKQALCHLMESSNRQHAFILSGLPCVFLCVRLIPSRVTSPLWIAFSVCPLNMQMYRMTCSEVESELCVTRSVTSISIRMRKAKT